MEHDNEDSSDGEDEISLAFILSACATFWAGKVASKSRESTGVQAASNSAKLSLAMFISPNMSNRSAGRWSAFDSHVVRVAALSAQSSGGSASDRDRWRGVFGGAAERPTMQQSEARALKGA